MKMGKKHKNLEKCKGESTISLTNVPAQSSLYISIISSPDLKFCPDLFGDLESRSYFVPILSGDEKKSSANYNL